MRTRSATTNFLGQSLTTTLVLAFAGAPAIAQPAFELELLTPTRLLVAPGQSIAHALRIRNIGDATGAASLTGYWHLLNHLGDWPYTLGPASDVRCGDLTPGVSGTIQSVTAMLDPAETLDCEWHIHRPAESVNDTHLIWTAGATPSNWSGLTLIGTLTDISVQTRTLTFHIDEQGIGRARFELTIENHGPVAVRPWGVGACYYGDVPVLVEESTHPGGCGGYPPVWAPVCATGGEYAFGTPALAPGQRHQCTFDARTREPYQTPVGMDVQAPDSQSSLAGGTLLDSDTGNNQSWFIVGPTGSPVVPVPLDSLGRGTPPLLALLLGMIATLSLARRRRRAQEAGSE